MKWTVTENWIIRIELDIMVELLPSPPPAPFEHVVLLELWWFYSGFIMIFFAALGILVENNEIKITLVFVLFCKVNTHHQLANRAE